MNAKSLARSIEITTKELRDTPHEVGKVGEVYLLFWRTAVEIHGVKAVHVVQVANAAVDLPECPFKIFVGRLIYLIWGWAGQR